MYIGTCKHEISAEWYKNPLSSYTVLDKSGYYSYVTTCEECRTANEHAGRIIADDDLPDDDFEYDGEPSLPKMAVVKNDKGEIEVITLDNEPEIDIKSTLGSHFTNIE